MTALLERVLALLALVVAAGPGVAFAFLRKKVRDLEGETAAEQALLAALVEADKVARDAVLYAKQVFVDALKENTKDNKLTLSEAEHAMQVALSYFKRHMSENSLKR
ncbi:MAG: hypothetical protein HPY83_19560 [Anaerolineae bacterium]|nr:hypothetical protein [Anaerolineae bacterium]